MIGKDIVFFGVDADAGVFTTYRDLGSLCCYSEVVESRQRVTREINLVCEAHRISPAVSIIGSRTNFSGRHTDDAGQNTFLCGVCEPG